MSRKIELDRSTSMTNSKCALLGPGLGSACPWRTDEFCGRRRNARWVIMASERGPACVSFHCWKTSAASVALRLSVSKVLVELTNQAFAMRGWSARFWPTPGKSTRGLIPTALRLVLFPMPEFNRMWGEPIDPADRMTSFVAVTVLLDPTHVRHGKRSIFLCQRLECTSYCLC